MKAPTLIQRLLDAGYPKEDIHHHCSDLYIYVTPLTTKIVDEWCNENGFTKNWHCPTFTDQITGRKMYDCAFCYYLQAEKCMTVPFVITKLRRKINENTYY